MSQKIFWIQAMSFDCIYMYMYVLKEKIWFFFGGGVPLYSYKNSKIRHLSNVKFFLRETTLRGEPLIIDTTCDFFSFFYKTLSMNMFNKQKKINFNQFLQACLPVIHCLRSSGVASTSWKVMSLMKLSNLSRRVWNVPTVYGRASPSPGCSAISDIV